MLLNTEYGKVKVTLNRYIKRHKINKTKLAYAAEMQKSQIDNYCSDKITRVDLEVIGRLCTVLECDITDLLEFIPPEDK